MALFLLCLLYRTVEINKQLTFMYKGGIKMHSKVIIASLACAMAASFANGRISNASVAKASQPKAQETSCCNAPNEDVITPGLYSTKPYQNCDFCVFLGGIEYQSSLADGLTITENPSRLSTYIGYNPAYGHYFDVAQPTTDGDHYVTIGSLGKKIATLYICRKNGLSYGSVYSKNDAREKCYFATNSSASIIRQAATQFQASTSAFNTVKEYCSYVYGTDDITTTMNVISRPSGAVNDGTTLKFRVVWQAEDKTYPAKDIPFHVAARGLEINPSVEKKTDYNGEYSIKLSSSMTSGLKLNEIGYAMSTDTAVTEVLSDSNMNYPYYGKYSLSWSISSYKTINFNITIYPSRSDRAAAYEITQAQQLMSSYLKNYTNKVADKITTNYPAQKTSYVPSIYGQKPKINVKKDHYHTWDALNHEYAHYICDDSGLCYISSENNPHNINEDLSIEYGQDLGAKLAYSEGLATFMVLAGQIKHAIYSNGAYANVVAGYNYYDNVNGVDVDYYENKYGQPYSPHNRYVESSITSVLIKLLFQAYNIGETNIWSAIIDAGWSDCTIEDFFRELMIRCPSGMNDMYTIASTENISLPNIEPNGIAEWTIMIYMCGSTLEDWQTGGGHATDSIRKILNCSGQPSDVNIIIETGGCVNWHAYGIPNNKLARYHIRNKQLVLDHVLNTYTGMGEQSTFESFLRWGLNMYPARKTGVILWNHGGAVNGVCQDELDPDDTLLVSESTNALKNVFREKNYSSNYRLEFVGYDACLMQVQDVADYNSNYFKYMVASEEVAIDYMWPYDKWVDDLYAGVDTETLLKTIVDTFVFENQTYTDMWEQTLSVLDLSKMAVYRQKYEGLAQEIADFIMDNSISNEEMLQRYNYFISTIIESVHKYANELEQNWYKIGTNDVYHFLEILKNDAVFGEALGDTAADLQYFLYPNKIMKSQHPDEEDEVSTFGTNARRTLVLYKRSDRVIQGQWRCCSHGLSMHVYTTEEHFYPASETRFTKWRYLFFGLKDTIYSML